MSPSATSFKKVALSIARNSSAVGVASIVGTYCGSSLQRSRGNRRWWYSSNDTPNDYLFAFGITAVPYAVFSALTSLEQRQINNIKDYGRFHRTMIWIFALPRIVLTNVFVAVPLSFGFGFFIVPNLVPLAIAYVQHQDKELDAELGQRKKNSKRDTENN